MQAWHLDAVVHAAAMKQVPTCEAHPMEAIDTNVVGSANVIESALDVGVPKVLAVFVAFIFFLPWMLSVLTSFMTQVFLNIPLYGQ